MCENRFYICRHCGNLIGLIEDSGVPIKCCGQPMQQLEPMTGGGGGEKHLPLVEVANGKVVVNVGAILHPMESGHSIGWVYLQTDRGGHRKCLFVGEEPKVNFTLDDEKPEAVYAYCNKHGLWKQEI